MKLSEIQKFQFSNSLLSREKFASTVSGNSQKPQYSISFMNWKKLINSKQSNINEPQF